MNEAYDEATKTLFAFLVEHDLVKTFRDVMKARADVIARQMIGVNDANLMFALKGQISICCELHDGAKAALDAKKAEATAGGADGNPNLPDMEL